MIWRAALSPDGARYLEMGRGKPIPRPFLYRWILPLLCKDDVGRWTIASWSALIGLCLLIWYMTGQPFLAALIFFAPSMRWLRDHPVLVDLPGLFLAVLAAAVAPHNIVLAMCLVVFAGTTNEKAPLFAAIYAWEPLLLLGLAAPLAAHFLMKPGPDVLDEENAWILQFPRRASIKFHANFGWKEYVAPWGGMLFAVFYLTPELVVALVVAYAMTLYATDTARLYLWAAPAAIIALASADPVVFPALVLLSAANPYNGRGTW